MKKPAFTFVHNHVRSVTRTAVGMFVHVSLPEVVLCPSFLYCIQYFKTYHLTRLFTMEVIEWIRRHGAIAAEDVFRIPIKHFNTYYSRWHVGLSFCVSVLLERLIWKTNCFALLSPLCLPCVSPLSVCLSVSLFHFVLISPSLFFLLPIIIYSAKKKRKSA